ncbi:MAG: hypothetical protein ACRDHZ_09995, partial [Ktedonobacteraceae bacterium]
MKTIRNVAVASCALALFAGPVCAASASHPDTKGSKQGSSVPAPQSQQSVTSGTVSVEGHSVKYKAIAGVMIIKNSDGKPYTSMSYFAYIKTGVGNETKRPLTFFYNGGPGYSTAWLHMLAWGPKLAVVGNGTLTPPPPYTLTNNTDSLLDATDEVFIDEPATGFGRVLGKDQGGVGKPADVFGVDP